MMARPGRTAAVVGAVVAFAAVTLMGMLAGSAAASTPGTCTDNVNVRAEPVAGSRIVALCEAGTDVTTGAVRNGFVRIESLGGWAAEQYIAVEGAPSSTAPRTAPSPSSSSDDSTTTAPSTTSPRSGDSTGSGSGTGGTDSGPGTGDSTGTGGSGSGSGGSGSGSGTGESGSQGGTSNNSTDEDDADEDEGSSPAGGLLG